MRKSFRTFALLLASSLAVSIFVGCGGDDDTVEEVVQTNFVAADPPSGSEIAANASITLTFDNAPADVTANVGAVVPSGKTAIVLGPFTPGPLNLTVIWADGTQTLTYTVASPCCASPAVITGGTVKDGDMNVDPEVINSTGKIEIIFSEDVTGRINIITQAGEEVGWIGKVEGNKATLERVKGREIRYHMVYIIMGKVADALGNEAAFKIRFFTKTEK
ncbi:MAG: hypothetical protein OXU36_15670 [Candidatus Poribacteria bacterium]|nr:hypothetical protein [Candidatus Poribacteria bacterium]